LSARAPFSTCLFDLDGTLIDSVELIMASFRHTMQVHLGHVPPDEDWRAGFGRPLRTQLGLFSEGENGVEAMAATYREHNRTHHDRLVHPYAGVREALDMLRQRDATLAVVTSKTRDLAWRGLRHCGLDGYFEVLIGIDDVTHGKPHPAPVLAALDRVDADPASTVFIGDSPHDVESGHAAGVRTAAVRWGPFAPESFAARMPHYWLAEPAEIPSLSP
jgi:pyrophosphatase PpaX